MHGREGISALRYDVLRRGTVSLVVLCVEELNHAPQETHTIEFHFDDESISGCGGNVVMQAQVRAFCRSYLRRFGPA